MNRVSVVLSMVSMISERFTRCRKLSRFGTLYKKVVESVVQNK